MRSGCQRFCPGFTEGWIRNPWRVLPPLHQMVDSAPDLRISRSAVRRDRPSTRAVAAMTRSEGSLGKEAGRARACMQMSAVMGRTMNLRSTSDRNDARLVRKSSRPKFEIRVSSRSVISEMARPLAFCRSRSIAALALFEMRAGSRPSQTTT